MINLARVLAAIALTMTVAAHAKISSLVSESDDLTNPGGQGGRTPDMDGSGDVVAYVSPSAQLDDELWEIVSTTPPLAQWTYRGDQIYLRELASGNQELISRDLSAATVAGNGASWEPTIDSSGRYVAFVSSATNLTDDPASSTAEVFRFDRQTGQMHRFSNTYSGANTALGVANTGAVVYQRSADAPWLGDSNGVADVYLAPNTNPATHKCISKIGGISGNGASTNPMISGDGRFVVYESEASNWIFRSMRSQHSGA